MRAPELDDERTWAILTTGAGIAAGALTRWALRRGWTVTTGSEPPDGSRGADAGRVVLWSVLAAGTVALARVVAHRGARRLWTDGLGRDVPDAS